MTHGQIFNILAFGGYSIVAKWVNRGCGEGESYIRAESPCSYWCENSL